MALENEELQREMADLTRQMQGLGTASAAAAKAQTTLAQKTNSVIGQVEGLASGGGSFKSLNGVIDLTAKAVGGLLSVIPGVGGALKEMAGAVGEAAKYAMQQFDQLAQNYQALGESSALASDGIEGMQRQFRNIGLVSLPAFTRAINQNATGLTAFGGSITQGTEQFSKLAGAMVEGDLGQGFLKLGMSFDQVGESTGKFVGTFSRYGLTQGKTFEELRKSTADYILEVDQIARITGQSRKQQEDEQKKNEADVRFRAKLADMRARGETEQAQELATYVAGLGGAAGEAARAMLTGVAMTDQANKANMLSMDQLRQNTLAVANGQKKAADGIEATQKGMAQGAQQYRGLMMTAGENFGGVAIQAFDAEALMRAREKYMSEGLSAADAAKKAQEDLLKAGGKTEEFTSAQSKVAGINKDMANLTFNSMTAAMGAVDNFASAIKKVTGFIDEKFGGKPSTETKEKSWWEKTFGGGPAAPTAATKAAAPAAEVTVTPSKATGTQKEFLDTMYANLLAEAKKQGVKNPEVVAKLGTAQSALETGYGKHTAGSQNYFGIKARPGEGGSGVATQEFINGKMVTVNDKFRKYGSMQESAADYVKFLTENKRYKGVLGAGTLEEAIAEQGKTGYATDPAYAQKLAGIAGKIPGGATPAGPSSGYAGTSLAAATPQASLPTPPGQQSQIAGGPSLNDQLMAMQKAQMDSLAVIARNTQQQVDVSKKIQSRQT